MRFCTSWESPPKWIYRPPTVDDAHRDLVVTRSQVLRKPLRELNLTHRHGVNITRVDRNTVALTPTADLVLKFGDRVAVVGPENGVKAVEIELGNSLESLNRSQLMPIFLGMVLGIIVGGILRPRPRIKPEHTHWLGRRADAGGHRAVAAWQHWIDGLVHAGGRQPAFPRFRPGGFPGLRGVSNRRTFLSLILNHDGARYILAGIIVTVLPVLLVAILARMIWNMNFITLAGWDCRRHDLFPGPAVCRRLNRLRIRRRGLRHGGAAGGASADCVGATAGDFSGVVTPSGLAPVGGNAANHYF